MRFCLVGAGTIGAVHAANIAAHREAELRWVVDLDPAAAGAVAGRFGARATARLGDPLEDPAVDAVLVCTPPRTHAAIVEAAARAGKAIFCEKPVDLDPARVEACGETLRRTGVPFFVGFNRRFDPTHAALRAAIAAGRIGRPEMVVVSSRDPEIAPPDYVAAMPYGIFYDTMIHDFDMARWLTGREPVEVYARTATRLGAAVNPMRDPDTAMALLTMDDGTLVHVDASFRAVYGYDQRIEVFGEAGMLASGNQRPTSLTCHDATGVHADPLQRFFVERYAAAYAAELDHFVAAVSSRTAPSVGFEDGRRALRIAYAAMESARSGAPVQIAS